MRHPKGMLPMPPTTTVELWPAGPPNGWRIEGAETRTRDEGGVLHIANVSRPRLEIFPPVRGMGDPVIVAPGGGYWIVAGEHEGTAIGEWLAARGRPAYVLVYRLPRPDLDAPRWAVPLEDMRQALKLVRARHPGRPVTALGFSAGGHLAAAAAHRPDGPDRLVLVYPAYLGAEGGGVAPEVLPTRAVPTFAAVALDDHRRPAELAAWAAASKAAVELHLEGDGGHGYGFRPHGKPAPWLGALERWLAARP